MTQNPMMQQSGERLLASLEAALPQESSLRLEAQLWLRTQPRQLQLGLRIGEGRLYVVRNLGELLEARRKGTRISYGKGFLYCGDWMRFGEAEERFLSLLETMALLRYDTLGAAPLQARMISIPESGTGRLLAGLENVPLRVAVLPDEGLHATRVVSAALPLYARLEGNSRRLQMNIRYPAEVFPLTEDCAFVWTEKSILHVPEDQRALLREILAQKGNGSAVFAWPTAQAGRVFGEVLPFLQRIGVVELAPELAKHLVRLPLRSCVYLDRAGRDITARVEFCYGEQRINPFMAALEDSSLLDNKLILRDGIQERRLLDVLAEAGFRVRQGMIFLSGDEAIYRFLTEEIDKLMQLGDVYLSREFQQLAPRRPAMHGQMRLKGGRLEVELEDNDTPDAELLRVIEALARHRQYVRLRDGRFLTLADMADWQPLAESLADAAAVEKEPMEGNVLQLQGYRMMYLAALLEDLHGQVELDSSVQEARAALTGDVPEEFPLPEGLSLHPYQVRGSQWLCQLDRLRMGGILADDMGLGKTVQVIAAIRARQQQGECSLIVAPSSLVYNWQRELERFAPEMRTLVMGGSAEARAQQITQLEDVDVLITSYPLIRRDVDQMREIPFHFVVLDEAQNIKNAGSLGASAVKQLRAQTRFALTGTPMENGLGELWSIFDFVLPGYLLSYASFLKRYQEESRLEELRARIQPFLMRRLKKDVLTELPEKMERQMVAGMTPEQTKVYQAARVRLQGRVEEILAQRGLNRGRHEVLAAITELREICCHPALVLPDYQGSSGKMELLEDLLPEAIAEGHRVLLFSQFASMLRILRQRLEADGFQVLLLDGQTPPERRLELTEMFNAGRGDIFLISRGAGGTGLNLTGADMVIHYDPWWNPAAEDQATDRAYRIGQHRNVEVIRLVTHHSIEEQVLRLSLRKRDLFDRLIVPGEGSLSGLQESDIRALFQ